MKNYTFTLLFFISFFMQAQTWNSVQPPAPANTSWMDIHEVNNHAVAVGSNGQIALTNSNGASWDMIISGTSMTFRSVNFMNEKEGILVGDSGYIMITQDSGRTWVKKNSGTTQPLYGAIMVSNMEMFAVGGSSNALILRSVDGGTTWTNATFAPVSNTSVSMFTGINRLTDKIYMASGQIWDNASSSFAGAVYMSTDSGITWELNYLFKTFSTILNSLHFINPSVGVVVGDKSLYRKTDDGGMSYLAGTSSMQGNLNILSVYVKSKDEFYFTTIQGEFYKTINGGANWSITTLKTNQRLNKIFVNSKNGHQWIAAEGDLYLWGTNPSGIDMIKRQSISIYPNPVLNVIHLELEKNDDVKIYDLTGKVRVSKALVAGPQNLAVDNLPQGIYIVEVGNKTARFVKE